MCVPFIHEGQIVGMIALAAKHPDAFSRSALHLLTVLAHHIEPAVAAACSKLSESPFPLGEQHRISYPLLGESEAVQKVNRLIEQVARQPVNILITGETGSGKEVVARAIHERSPRPDGPFVCVNCASIPEDIFEAELFGHEKGAFTGAYRSKPGKFELAEDGTLFFDEISDLPLPLQAKLLRVLESREFMHLGGTKVLHTNARFLFATNQNLQELVKRGRFREDLLFRINTLEIHVPTLQERLEDIPDLAEYFLEDIQIALKRPHPFRFTSAVLGSFLAYSWPGNIRELRNVLEQMAVLADGEILDEGHLPERIRVETASPQWDDISRTNIGLLTSITDKTQKQMILHALSEAKGQKKRAAEILGISRPTLDKKLRLFGISK